MPARSIPVTRDPTAGTYSSRGIGQPWVAGPAANVWGLTHKRDRRPSPRRSIPDKEPALCDRMSQRFGRRRGIIFRLLGHVGPTPRTLDLARQLRCIDDRARSFRCRRPGRAARDFRRLEPWDEYDVWLKVVDRTLAPVSIDDIALV